MQDLRVIELRALSHIGATTFMEVSGKLVMRHGRRLYDHANHPDPMMNLEDAAVRFHTRGSSTEWQAMPRLTINRDRLLLVAPGTSADATVPSVPDARELLVSLMCGPLQVMGTVLVPPDVSVGDYINQLNSRFLAVGNSRVKPHSEGIALGDFQEPVALCYVNSDHVDACLEAERPTGNSATAESS